MTEMWTVTQNDGRGISCQHHIELETHSFYSLAEQHLFVYVSHFNANETAEMNGVTVEMCNAQNSSSA